MCYLQVAFSDRKCIKFVDHTAKKTIILFCSRVCLKLEYKCRFETFSLFVICCHHHSISVNIQYHAHLAVVSTSTAKS